MNTLYDLKEAREFFEAALQRENETLKKAGLIPRPRDSNRRNKRKTH